MYLCSYASVITATVSVEAAKIVYVVVVVVVPGLVVNHGVVGRHCCR